MGVSRLAYTKIIIKFQADKSRALRLRSHPMWILHQVRSRSWCTQELEQQ